MRTALAAAAIALLTLAGCSASDSDGGPGAGDTASPSVSGSSTPSPSASESPSASPSAPSPSAPSPSPSETEDDGEGIEIEIEGDEIEPNGERVKVERGERIILEITSDRAGELHVHSTPDQELAFKAGQSTLTLTVDTPGVVDVEEHDSGIVIVQLEVR